MKPQPGNIRQMTPHARGACGICELPALLVVEDTVTTLKAGLCCAEALVFTDHMLTLHVGKTGIIHPPLIVP